MLLASLFYTIEIYADFSGYSDLAIGISNLLGFSIKENFNAPYLADSVGDFWRRWHISLSSWLKDYIYIPLGGSRCSRFRNAFNLLITFLISGIWHGSSINFVLWGGIHGVAQIIERNLKGILRKIVKPVRIVMVWIFINFSWVIFRLTTFEEIEYFFKNMLVGISHPVNYVISAQQSMHMDAFTCARLFLLIIGIMFFDFLSQKNSFLKRIIETKRWKRNLIFAISLVVLFILLPVELATDYIYFRF